MWSSPISSDTVAESKQLSFQDLVVDENGNLFWLENQSAPVPTSCIVRSREQERYEKITPDGFDVGSLLYDNGGGAFLVHDGTLYACRSDFSSPPFFDQRIYKQVIGQEPTPLTKSGPYRYGDLTIDSYRKRIICIREDRSAIQSRASYPTHTIVAISTAAAGDSHGQVLMQGDDFYSAPAISPDGNQLAWISWNLPLMPWEECQLWIAQIEDDGSLSQPHQIVGLSNQLSPEVPANQPQSICQPQWSPDGVLYFVSDRDNWWNIYRWTADGIEAVTRDTAEYGYPHWLRGQSTYACLDNGELIAARNQRSNWELVRIAGNTVRPIAAAAALTAIRSVRSQAGTIAFIAGGPTISESLFQFEAASDQLIRVKASFPFTETRLESFRPYLSVPELISYPTPDLGTGIAEAYGVYYPPIQPESASSPETPPPVILNLHGGPTFANFNHLNWDYQFFTSRGFGLLEVNYRGSTGYGRAYRLALYGHWGEVDRVDGEKAVQWLIAEGKADAARIAARGNSSGGFTVLGLATFSSNLSGGAVSWSGIVDPIALIEIAPKLEASYLPKLLTGFAPDDVDAAARARSAYFNVDQVNAPLLIFHGEEDRIVPLKQVKSLLEKLKAAGKPVAHQFFPREGHLFLSGGTLKAALDQELKFYQRVQQPPATPPAQNRRSMTSLIWLALSLAVLMVIGLITAFVKAL